MTEPSEKPLLLSSSPRRDERATAGMFALEVMHEIRNPLEAVGHLTYLARMEAEQPEQVRKYMLLAEEQLAILNRIASQTLGFARVAESPDPSIWSAWLRQHCGFIGRLSRPRKFI